MWAFDYKTSFYFKSDIFHVQSADWVSLLSWLFHCAVKYFFKWKIIMFSFLVFYNVLKEAFQYRQSGIWKQQKGATYVPCIILPCATLSVKESHKIFNVPGCGWNVLLTVVTKRLSLSMALSFSMYGLITLLPYILFHVWVCFSFGLCPEISEHELAFCLTMHFMLNVFLLLKQNCQVLQNLCCYIHILHFQFSVIGNTQIYDSLCPICFPCLLYFIVNYYF